MQRPSSNAVTLAFGATTSPYSESKPHIGVDFSPNPDNTIYAPEDGYYRLVPNDGTCGDAVHMYAGNRHHAFCHTSKYLISDNQFVPRGGPIAIMGDTGYAFGVHLHWALKVNDQFVDPLTQVTEGEDMATIEVLQSALNEARHRAELFESALYAERAKTADLESKLQQQQSQGVTKDAVIAYIQQKLQ